MSCPLLRYFIQAFAPLAVSRETLVPAGFSKQFNDLQNPKNTRDPERVHPLIR